MKRGRSGREWAIAYFRKVYGDKLVGKSDDDLLEMNYFDNGLVDSLGVVTLILSAEEHFGISLGQTQFDDPRFQVIGGLGDIIENIVGASGK